MICCEVEKQSANIAFPSIEQDMYRNLPSDTSQPTSDGGFFQPSYSQRINSSQTYASSSYGSAQATFSASEHAQGASNQPHEYSSQFFVSEINSHFPVESSSAAHCNWSHGAFYPSDSLPPMLNPCNSWDPNNPSLGHPHPTGLGSGFSAVTDPTIQSSFIEAAENSNLPPVSLTGIESFSAGAEGSSSVALHLPALQHRALPAQRRPYEWINKNAYQNPQTQQGKTRTKDKYRVVYSDHQRLELEKEFRFSRYITIRRKSELAAQLCLSERQVKIWFQNRRAKERKASKKSTNLNPEMGDGADNVEDGETSDNSGRGDISPVINSVSRSQLSPSQHSNSTLAYNQVPPMARSPLSPQPQDDILEQQSCQLSYPYGTKMESLRETANFSPLPEIDIKPLLTGSNEPRRVTSSTEEGNVANNDSPINMHHHKLNDL